MPTLLRLPARSLIAYSSAVESLPKPTLTSTVSSPVVGPVRDTLNSAGSPSDTGLATAAIETTGGAARVTVTV